MDKRTKEALDNHITGNWGEDQLRTDDEGFQFFDVTCSIGRVTFDGEGNPYEEAMKLIAQHGTEGTFSFPGADGRAVIVDIQFKGNPHGNV